MTARQAFKVKCTEWSDIQNHMPLLYNESHGNVMEIGTRQGFSTSALLAGIEDHRGHLYSVDISDYSSLFYNHPDWTFIRADSIKEVDRLINIIPHLDLLFVDGDHTYEGCLSDLRNFGPRAKKILVHDCECPLTFPGVRKACEQYTKDACRSFRIISGSYGMGVIE